MVCVLLRPAIAAARLGRSRCRSTVPARKTAVLGLAAAAMLAGCSSGSDRVSDARLAPASKRYTNESYSARVADGSSIPKGGGTYKLGSPYKIGGRWYVPREEPTYDQMGVASWYGEDFHGRKTANGEVYDMNALTAAHPTLPLPSYAYVTNLNNGRTALVRINDRGPYANDRLIDLSRQTSRMLGYEGHGLARVRIRVCRPRPSRWQRHLRATLPGEPVLVWRRRGRLGARLCPATGGPPACHGSALAARGRWRLPGRRSAAWLVGDVLSRQPRRPSRRSRRAVSAGRTPSKVCARGIGGGENSPLWAATVDGRRLPR